MFEQHEGTICSSRVTQRHMWKSPERANPSLSGLFPRILLAHREKKMQKATLKSESNVKDMLPYPYYHLSASIWLQVLGYLHNGK